MLYRCIVIVYEAAIEPIFGLFGAIFRMLGNIAAAIWEILNQVYDGIANCFRSFFENVFNN